MNQYKDLIESVASSISTEKKSYNINEYCKELGIDDTGRYEGGSASKYKYALEIVGEQTADKLLEIAVRVANDFDHPHIRKILHRYTNNYGLKITCDIRRAVFQELDEKGFNLHGKSNAISFIELNYSFVPDFDFDAVFGVLGGLLGTGTRTDPPPIPKLKKEIIQHFINNSDYTSEQVYLEKLGFEYASDEKFIKLFADALNPTIRQGSDEVKQLACILNKHLAPTGWSYFEHEKNYYRAVLGKVSTAKPIANIIFASVKAKPDIIFNDALENKIEVKNADDCLMYDRHISATLTIQELDEWWKATRKTKEKLSDRMAHGLNGAEQKVYDTYYKRFCGKGKECLTMPALIPQVYLHYDTKTLTQLHGKKRLPFQRMDFLLLAQGRRIIIEVDGIEHYSDDDKKASPERYANMVAYDRQMQCNNYEVYRIGGYELRDGTDHEKTLLAFFDDLKITR